MFHVIPDIYWIQCGVNINEKHYMKACMHDDDDDDDDDDKLLLWNGWPTKSVKPYFYPGP